MIDLKHLRTDPERFAAGARDKGVTVDIDGILRLDEQIRRLIHDREQRRAEQNKISKEIGPQIGKLKGQAKNAQGEERDAIEKNIRELEHQPLALKTEIQAFDQQIAQLEPQLHDMLLRVPQPPDADVPKGKSSDDNIELRTWNPKWFDPKKSFKDNKGFSPRTHLELIDRLKLVDFERGVKMAGTRHYVLSGDGMRLHQAVLRFAFDFITNKHGFRPMSVPVIVREECMVGTGFFPAGREQAYMIEESKRDAEAGGKDLFLTGTGEVGLMGLHADEIVSAESLPLKYATVSTCFRREAGAAGKDTAGLYRIHQFDKVEQVVICKADEAESRMWHKKMIGIVEELLQALEMPYRLLQCCTGDLGVKNADMVDIETWMPGRGATGADGKPTGAYGETHSASRLYDFQCRRLNMRYKDADGKNIVCHSLNNTVLASPRVLIPILELYQNEDGSVTVPSALREYMGGRERIS
ncbi:MAG TPA: serine--tRNA ligase [Phycisphaerales bacterium]|nr:serine--tRNA ligase [Phycisphaerales bacterium]